MTALRSTRTHTHRNAMFLIGFGVTFIAAIATVILAFSAAAAENLNFFEMHMLSDFGYFILIWNYNPSAWAVVLLTALIGTALIYASAFRNK